jgi:hypothetical protein
MSTVLSVLPRFNPGGVSLITSAQYLLWSAWACAASLTNPREVMALAWAKHTNPVSIVAIHTRVDYIYRILSYIAMERHKQNQRPN